MADYYSLISRAISALPGQTPDARQGVYERARKALVNQLRSIQPPVADADIAAESRALEEAITRLELELAKSNVRGAQSDGFQTDVHDAGRQIKRRTKACRCRRTAASACADRRRRAPRGSRRV